MTSFEEHMRAAQDHRRELDEQKRREKEEAAQRAAEFAERIRLIRERAEQLIPEVEKAVAALRNSGRRESNRADNRWVFNQADGWAYRSDYVVYAISLDGSVTVSVRHGPLLPLADLVRTAYFSWTTGGAGWEPNTYFHTVTADEALNDLVRSIATYLTGPA